MQERVRRARARQLDDPGFARALDRVLTEQRVARLPSGQDLAAAAVVTSGDQRSAARALAGAGTLAALIGLVGAQMARAARRFRTGVSAADQWFTRHLALVKRVQVAAALAAFGTRVLDAAQTRQATQLILQQYAFAHAFFADVLDGRQRYNGRLDARAALYAGAGRVTFATLTRQVQAAAGMRWERNVLGAQENCRDCAAQTALGWAPIGTLSPIGARACRANCRCTLAFAAVRPLETP